MLLVLPDVVTWPVGIMLTLSGLLIQLVCCYFTQSKLSRCYPLIVIGVLLPLVLGIHFEIPPLSRLSAANETAELLFCALCFCLLGTLWGWSVWWIDRIRKHLRQ